MNNHIDCISVNPYTKGCLSIDMDQHTTDEGTLLLCEAIQEQVHEDNPTETLQLLTDAQEAIQRIKVIEEMIQDDLMSYDKGEDLIMDLRWQLNEIFHEASQHPFVEFIGDGYWIIHTDDTWIDQDY